MLTLLCSLACRAVRSRGRGWPAFSAHFLVQTNATVRGRRHGRDPSSSRMAPASRPSAASPLYRLCLAAQILFPHQNARPSLWVKFTAPNQCRPALRTVFAEQDDAFGFHA